MSLAAEVFAAAAAKGCSLAVAESLTGGAVIDALVGVPGASTVLRGGIVAYATDLKHRLLDVPAGLLAERGAVDPDVAEAMALGALERTGARVAVATTGVAGPEPQDGKPVGLVYLGVAGTTPAPWVDSAEFRFAGDRAAVRAQAVEAALRALLAGIERA